MDVWLSIKPVVMWVQPEFDSTAGQHYDVLHDGNPHRADAYFTIPTTAGDTLFLIFSSSLSSPLLYPFPLLPPPLLYLLFYPPGPAATGAGPHQPVHLQPASVYGWAGAGEHAEAAGSRHLHEDTEGCQRGQQRSRLRQVDNNNNNTNVTQRHSILLLWKQ